MNLKKIISILLLGFALQGCLQKEESNLSRQLRDAEDFYLQIQPKRALEILNQIDSSQDLPDRYFRLRYQAELRDFQFIQALKTVLSWGQRGSGRKDKDLVVVLKAFLRHCTELKKPSIKLEAIGALGELRDTESSDLLMGLFPGGSQMTRIAVCYAMNLLGDRERALPYLVDRSRFAGLKSRFLASLFLTKLQDDRLIYAYMNMLSDPDDAIRVLAIKTLGLLKAREAVDKLEIIFKDSASSQVKMIAAQALFRLGRSSYQSYLLQNVESKSNGLNAKILLTELGDKQFLEELKASLVSLEVEAQHSVLTILVKNGDTAFVREKLRSSLESLLGDAFEKKMALELLLIIKDPSDWDTVQSHFFSPFQEVQVMAAKVMLGLLS